MLVLESQTMSTEPDYLHWIFEFNNTKMSVYTCVYFYVQTSTGTK